MKNSQDVVKKKDPPLIDSDDSDSMGLLKTGIFSFLLHIVLIGFLMFSLKAETTKSSPLVYRVTIKPLSLQNNSPPPPLQALPAPQPAPPKPPMRKEENKSKEEEKKIEPTKEEVKQIEPKEESKQPPQPPLDKQTIEKPIPLPMAETSTLSTDSTVQKEEIPSSLTALSPAENNETASSESNVGDGMGTETSTRTGTGTGTGGSILGGSPEGEGAGREGSRWGGGPGEGMGRGSSSWAGSGKGLGTASGVPGVTGSEKGTGTGSGVPGTAGSRKGTGTGRWGRAGSGDDRSGMAAPRYGQNPKPFYPIEAREKGYQGDVVVKVEVLPNGQVGEVEVEKSSGYEILDQSAVTTVKKWRFIPAKQGGVAIPCWVNIPIKFRLH
jgi:TonB family protein